MKNSITDKLRQIPPGCLILGVDPHKKKHAVVSMTLDARVWARRKFDNDGDGFVELMAWAREQMVSSGSSCFIFGIEAGGHYWRNLSYYLDGCKIRFHLVSPFTLKRRREGDDLDRKKNDYRDAVMAAELVRTGKYENTRLPCGIWAELRAAHSAHRRLIKESTRAKNVLKSLLDGLFPEFARAFKDVCCKTALAVLSTGATPWQIAQMSRESLMELTRRHFQGRGLAGKKLVRLQELAAGTAGVREGATSIASEVMFLAKRIILLMEQLKNVQERLGRLTWALPESSYLMSIRGIGYITAGGLLAELGPFNHYNSARQLIKMAGTNPTQAESAGKSSSHTPMSKKGRAGLRHVLWVAALNLVRVNEDFRSWAKVRQERPAYAHPLHRREVLGAVCNRLLRLAYALVSKAEFYRQPIQVEVAA